MIRLVIRLKVNGGRPFDFAQGRLKEGRERGGTEVVRYDGD